MLVFLLRWLLQVGPFSNPAETYKYYSLPFCQPENVKSQAQQLGEVLAGDRRVNTMYDIRFRGACCHGRAEAIVSIQLMQRWCAGMAFKLAGERGLCRCRDNPLRLRWVLLSHVSVCVALWDGSCR